MNPMAGRRMRNANDTLADVGAIDMYGNISDATDNTVAPVPLA